MQNAAIRTEKHRVRTHKKNTRGARRHALSRAVAPKATHMRSKNNGILVRPGVAAEFASSRPVTARAGLSWWGNSSSNVVSQEGPNAGGVGRTARRSSRRRRGGEHREPRRRGGHRREQEDPHGAGDCCGPFGRRNHVCEFVNGGTGSSRVPGQDECRFSVAAGKRR